MVKDDLTGEEWTIDTLKAGKSKTFKTKYTVSVVDAKKGEVVNVATAEATDNDGDTFSAEDAQQSAKTAYTESKAPKTGDDTQILIYLFSMSVAALLLLLVTRRKRFYA